MKSNCWSLEEDQLIQKICSQKEKFQSFGNCAWLFVAKTLNSKLNVNRTSKQCQYRWINHLMPGRKEEKVNLEQYLNRIIQLQHVHGNKWKLIASQMQSASDLEIKNIFYSHLKKGIRLLNSFMIRNGSTGRSRQRVFQQNCIYKIISQQQGKTAKLQSLSGGLSSLAKNIKQSLLNLLKNPNDQVIIQETIQNLHDFNCNCRRLRKKKIQSNSSSSDDSNNEQDHSEIPDPPKSQTRHKRNKKETNQKTIRRSEREMKSFFKTGTQSYSSKSEFSGNNNEGEETVSRTTHAKNEKEIGKEEKILKSILPSSKSVSVQCAYSIEGEIFIPALKKTDLEDWLQYQRPQLGQQPLPVEQILSIPTLYHLTSFKSEFSKDESIHIDGSYFEEQIEG